MSSVLHNQKLKQKQVIPSTMPGSFLFMFVTPRLSHVGLIARVPAQWLGFGTQFLNSAFNGSFSFAFFNQDMNHFVFITLLAQLPALWNIWLGTFLRMKNCKKTFIMFFAVRVGLLLVKPIWIRWCCLSMSFYLFLVAIALDSGLRSNFLPKADQDSWQMILLMCSKTHT